MNLPNVSDERIDMLLNGLSLLIKNYDTMGYTISQVSDISLFAKYIIQCRNQSVDSETKEIGSQDPVDIVKDRLGLKEDEEVPIGLGQH